MKRGTPPPPVPSVPPAPPAAWSAAASAAHTPDSHIPKPKLGKTALTSSILIHAVLLVLAAFWVISTIRVDSKKDSLFFAKERPSATADNKAAEHDAKMSKKKSMGGAPPNAKRLTAVAGTAISIPAVDASTITDFQPNRMSGGMGTGFGGFGSGAGGPGGGMGTGGGGGRIKFFGFEGDATSIILAIDVSGSMERNVGGPAGIEKLRDEISRTIKSLPPASLFNIICFAREADACFPRNVRATKENQEAALRFMGGYFGNGGFGRTRTEKLIADKQPTEVESAIVEDVKFAPITSERTKGLEGTAGSSRMDLAMVAAMERGASTVFLLSDGEPTPSRDGKRLEKDDIVALLLEHYKRLYTTRQLVVNTIYTNTDPREEGFMKKISSKFNGKHKDVKFE